MISEKGLTLIELMIYAAILSIIGTVISNWMTGPVKVAQMMAKTDSQIPAQTAINTFVSDLETAAPGGLNWATIPSQNPANPSPNNANLTSISFAKTSYDFSVPGGATTSSVTTYSYQTAGGVGSLVKQVDSNPPTVVLPNLDSPVSTAPLAQQDPYVSNVVIVTLLYHPPGQAQMPIIRRVAMR
ncbi:MAG TPA: type II secretion system protein, partial [Elusimicrobiota bacterium]|nr:type II secretion system protein [Elusimicrobiota bacterium]